MRRSKPGGAHDNHERWLLSYADFITLLFAFFVVLFASTQTDKRRAKAVSAAVDRALRNGTFTTQVASMLGGETKSKQQGSHAQTQPAPAETRDPPAALPHLKEHPDLKKAMDVLAGELQQEIKDQKLKLRLEQRGLVISLAEGAFFDSGEDAIKPAGYPIVEKLARVLRGLPNQVQLEGHTDSVPISNSRFHDNWDLSAARSIAMLRLLTQRFNIPEQRLAVVGYADKNARDAEQTPEQRARNRRVDIVVVTEEGANTMEPPDANLAGAKKN